MVNASDIVRGAFQLVFHSQTLQKSFSADLNAVAKAYGSDFRISLHVAAENCHRVSVIQEKGVGADLFHIPCKAFHYGNGTESAHDAANSQRITDSLLQAVFLGNFKISYGAGLIATYLNGIYNKVSVTQRFFSVFHTKIGFDNRSVFVYIMVDSLQDDF